MNSLKGSVKVCKINLLTRVDIVILKFIVMRNLAFLLLIILPAAFHSAESSYEDLWKSYKVKYQKYYPAKSEEARRSIWMQKVHKVAKHNIEADFGLHSYRVELNKFSDKIESELDMHRNGFLQSKMFHNSKPVYYKCDRNCLQSLPDHVDWRAKGFVTPVKDQGSCNSCWAFSATGALEGQAKAKTGRLVSLSEQNLIDCSYKEGNRGCRGGKMEYSFQYVINNKGIDTEDAYPYLGVNGTCKFKRSAVGAKCSKYVTIRPGSEKDLQAAVANIGPITIAIDSGGHNFMDYKVGIYYDRTCKSKQVNHSALVVGYGSENGKDYWIVKNSYGKDWGMDGYILMARNAHNMCGIATIPVYPII